MDRSVSQSQLIILQNEDDVSYSFQTKLNISTDNCSVETSIRDNTWSIWCYSKLYVKHCREVWLILIALVILW